MNISQNANFAVRSVSQGLAAAGAGAAVCALVPALGASATVGAGLGAVAFLVKIAAEKAFAKLTFSLYKGNPPAHATAAANIATASGATYLAARALPYVAPALKITMPHLFAIGMFAVVAAPVGNVLHKGVTRLLNLQVQ